MSATPIATVTLNPALDIAVAIDAVTLGATNRCSLDALDPGGKGINASRVLHRLGRKTIAFGFLGGVTGALLRERLGDEGLPCEFDEVDEPTRFDVMVYERDSGRRSRLDLPGARVDPAKVAALLSRLERLGPNALVILGGSVPPGLPDTIYHDAVIALRRNGIRSIVDTSGQPLAAAIAARPSLIKPNVEEAEAVLGRRLTSDGAILEAAYELRRNGPDYVVISQGADGAIGVGPDGAWKAVPPSIVARSTVGSGDSMVAGLAIGLSEGDGFAEGLRLGTAAGAATAMVPGTHLCNALDVERLLSNVTLRPLVEVREDVV